MSQTSYSLATTQAFEGKVEDLSSCIYENATAEGALPVGKLLQKGTTDGEAKPIAALPAADDDSVANAGDIASAASAQRLFGDSFTGATYAAGKIVPAQRLMFTLNNHADWDATIMKVKYLTAGGDIVIEDVPIPDSGNTILYTEGNASMLLELYIPAQSGTNGTMLVGTDPTTYALSRDSYPGIASNPGFREPYAAATPIADNQTFNLIRKGKIWVVVEAAVVKGAPAYVRMVESGADVRGQFRGSYAANFALYPNARFLTTQATADGLALLELS